VGLVPLHDESATVAPEDARHVTLRVAEAEQLHEPAAPSFHEYVSGAVVATHVPELEHVE
jgi:hypothetical protein